MRKGIIKQLEASLGS